MASSPWLPAAGSAPAPPLEEAAAAASAAAVTSAPTSEQLPVEEGGVSAAAAVQLQQQQDEEVKPQLPRDDDSEAEIQEHEQKINKYQAILAACLKAKFFSKKAFNGAMQLSGNASYFCQNILMKYLANKKKRGKLGRTLHVVSPCRNIFEAVTVVQGETIQSSRWPGTRSFANPEFFSQDKNSHETGTPAAAAADVSAKNSSTPLAGFTKK